MTLPSPTHQIGDTGHVTDHNAIVAFLDTIGTAAFAATTAFDAAGVAATLVGSETSRAEAAESGLGTSISGKYTKPGAGIPSTDMTTQVQALLAAAGTALQSITKAEVTGTGLAPADIGAATTASVTAAIATAEAASDAAGTATAAVATEVTNRNAAITSAIAGVTPASIGAATTASVAAAITTAEAASDAAGTATADVAAEATARAAAITSAIAAVTPASIGAATPSNVTTAVAGEATARATAITQSTGRFPCIDSYGSDPLGVSDSTAAVNAAIAALPTVNGQIAGTVLLGCGVYKISGTVTVLNPQVKIKGAGEDATVVMHYSSGAADCFRMLNPSDPRVTNGSTGSWPSILNWGGGFQDLTIDGTNAAASNNGIHYGDNEGGLIRQVKVQHYNKQGSVGVLLDNTLWWTEKLRMEVRVIDCNVGVQCQVSLQTGGTANAPGISFGYNNLQIEVELGAGQDALAVVNGANFYNPARIAISGNMTGASTAAGCYKVGTTTVAACLRISGTNPNASTGASISNALVTIQAECPSAAFLPYSIFFGTALTNFMTNCTGLLSFGAAGGFRACNDSPANNAGLFTFMGVIIGDATLNPGNPMCCIGSFTRGLGQVTVAGSTYTAKIAYADFFDMGTLTQNATLSITNTSVGPCEKRIRYKQAASGGPYTVTFPRNATPTNASPTVLFVGGTIPTASTGASAVDTLYLFTYDGATWYGRLDQAWA